MPRLRRRQQRSLYYPTREDRRRWANRTQLIPTWLHLVDRINNNQPSPAGEGSDQLGRLARTCGVSHHVLVTRASIETSNPAASRELIEAYIARVDAELAGNCTPRNAELLAACRRWAMYVSAELAERL